MRDMMMWKNVRRWNCVQYLTGICSVVIDIIRVMIAIVSVMIDIVSMIVMINIVRAMIADTADTSKKDIGRLLFALCMILKLLV